MSKTRIRLVLSMVIAAGILAACSATSPTETAATVSSTPAPTVTTTVTQAAAAPAPVVIVPPQAPVVVVPPVVRPPVVVAPVPVYQPPVSTTADQLVASDRYVADSTTGYWIPQLGSYTDSPSAMHRFTDLQNSGYDVIMVWSGGLETIQVSVLRTIL